MLAFMGNAYSQTSIEGKVRDSSTFEPILFAGVALYKNSVLITGAETDLNGNFLIADIQPGKYDLEIVYLGYKKTRIEGIICLAGQVRRLEIKLIVSGELLDEISILQYKVPLIEIDNTTVGTNITSDKISKFPQKNLNAIKANKTGVNTTEGVSVRGSRSNEKVIFVDGIRTNTVENNIEEYQTLNENHFINTDLENTTTLSIDVDRASYSNVRSYLNRGLMPNPNDVRIEEMINYFDYDWSVMQTEEHPFKVHHALTNCPWNPENKLLCLSLKAKDLTDKQLLPSNLVFLIDVSGSMDNPIKLPLLKQSLYLLIDQLREEDKISIVVYAGAAGTIIDGVSGSDKFTLKNAIEKLDAGGSTAGAQGIIEAYNLALKNFKPKGNNRVILATDGDFNVGISNDESLVQLIEENRKSNIYLSVLGFGTDNYQDGKMQKLANAGNGNHFYIDNLDEAKKTLLKEFSSTLFTLANDVKIQLTFNKEIVAEYKVIGYENRQLANEDFDNDAKDAGEIGAGHIVTVIYEIKPKYNKHSKMHAEIASLNFRYKSELSRKSVKDNLRIENNEIDIAEINSNFKWAICVAEFGLLLRNSTYRGASNYDKLLSRIDKMKEVFNDNHKLECISLIKEAKKLSVHF